MSVFDKKIALGHRGVLVSELCFGTLTMSRLQADLSPKSMVPVFRRALEMGINFFDTAHRYGTYEHVRLGLGDKINDVVITSKTDARTLAEAREQVELCFRSLGREMIDIFLLHQVEDEADLATRRPALDYLLKLREQGRVRSVGISSHKISGNLTAVNHADELDILYPVINMKGLGIIDGTLAQSLASLKRAKAAGLGTYAMKPLGGGHLRKNAKEAIDFLRDSDCVDVISIGMKSTAEVEVNTAFFADGELPVDEEKIRSVVAEDRRVMVNFLCKKCEACVEHCDQDAISLGERKAEIDAEKCIMCGYCAAHCPEFAIRVV